VETKESGMKGVILAGGNGTRLRPLTKVVNKHLLPVGGKPMLQHCVEKLTGSGIRDILIVTGGEHLGAIAEFLGSGKDFDCQFTYEVQDEAGGIAQALSLAEGFVGKYSMCVILGDNMFKDALGSALCEYERYDCLGAMVMLKEVTDPERFGVAEVELQYGESKHTVEDMARWNEISEGLCFGNGVPCVIGIEEKPANPKSNFAVTGVYFYDNTVFDIIRTLKPSDRGELEVTDINNEYVRRGQMRCMLWNGWWTDAGTPASYRYANELVPWDEEM